MVIQCPLEPDSQVVVFEEVHGGVARTGGLQELRWEVFNLSMGVHACVHGVCACVPIFIVVIGSAVHV